MAHERETWLNHGVAELLLRGRPVETADENAQAQADRLAGLLAEAARVGYAGRSEDGNGREGRDAGAGAGSGAATVLEPGELPGEAAALAAFRQAVGTVGRTAPRTPGRTDALTDTDTDADGIGTVRLAPEQRRRVGLPNFARPIRLGLAAAMAGCALSGVAAGAGYLYAPSAGESSPRPSNSVSGALTPEPLVSESPGTGVSSPPFPGESSGAGPDSVLPGATGTHPTEGTPGGPKGGEEAEKGPASGDGWNGKGHDKWYAKLVQACQEYRSGTIPPGKKKLLEDVAEGPEAVTRFCEELLKSGSGGDGHYEGAPGHGHGDDDGGGENGGSGGSGGGDGPQNGGPIDVGGSDGGTDGGGDGGTDGGGTDGGGTDGGGSDGGGTDGGSGQPSTGWPGGDYDETISLDPDPEAADQPPQLPVTPNAGTGSGTGPGPGPGTVQQVR
ncbi:hypothetical protein [Streptomyces sp. NPDC058653]|uniref:hypothetical protein n=1 Tax=Streptomyces sp. NPDC058653 TaxID=3346576 RepID=UPI003648D29E